MLRTKQFHSVPVAATTSAAAVDAVIDAAVRGPATPFRFVNSGTLDAAATTPGYMELLRGEGVNLPDGRPLAAVLRLTAPRALPTEQVRGPWLFEAVLDRGRRQSVRHFLLGADDQTLSDLERQIKERFPGAIVVGTYAPPFGNRSREELHRADSIVVESDANLVWVALGTPKQDAEALRIYRVTGTTTAAVGAAFDFTAGTKNAAPRLVQRLGCEWLFRLLSEPRRLWRRYLLGNSRFVTMTVRHFLSRA